MYGRKIIKNDTAVSFGLPILNFVTVKDAPDATKSVTETKVGVKTEMFALFVTSMILRVLM